MGFKIAMDSNFIEVMPYIFREEGGYVDNPKDPGGATNMGVTQGTLSGWMGRAATREDVKNLSKATAMEIYRKQYWDKIDGDHLPSGIDYAMLDFAVNSGPAHAIKMLQHILDVPASSMIDPRTMAGLAERPIQDTINALCDARAEWLKKLAAAATFGKGWLARVKRVRTRALALAAKVPDQAPQSQATIEAQPQPQSAPQAQSQSPLEPVVEALADAQVPQLAVHPVLRHPGAVGTMGSVFSSLVAILLEDGYLETGLAVTVMLGSVAGYWYYARLHRKNIQKKPA